MPLAAEQQIDAVVHQPFAAHAFTHTGFVEHVDRALLQHAGADALFHIRAALGFEDDGIDAVAVQKLPEQQARGARADDGDLGAHGGCLQTDGNRSGKHCWPAP